MPKITISTEYEFCSAHFLPKVPDTHKCKRLHGHNYKLCVILESESFKDGMVIDFFDIDKIVRPILDDVVDHRLLNDIPGLDNPTAENIALWFARNLYRDLKRPVGVRIYETPTCWAEVEAIDSTGLE
jgi:6-pyruvoyltetrahydropterin/6-carboxytetrahydropterin synthase